MKLYQILFSILIIGNLHAAKLGKMKDLFAKDDFSQWTKVNGEKVDKGWSIENGIVHRHAKSGDIITKEKFKDFELTFEWKISKAGNSGIKYRARGSLGLEYQVLDDQKHRDNKNPTHRLLKGIGGDCNTKVAAHASEDNPIKLEVVYYD